MLFKKRHIDIVSDNGVICNHRPTAKDTTLKFLKTEFLVFPPQYYAICTCCGNSFVFTKTEQGNIILIENEKEVSNNVDVK